MMSACLRSWPALLGLTLWWCACSSASSGRASGGSQEPSIVALKSSENPQFEGPVRGFIAQAPGPVSVFTLPNDESADTESIRDAVSQKSPALILALGSRAAVFAHTHWPTTPMVFAMVLSYRRLQLSGEQAAGIAGELSPTTEFAQFQMVVPQMKKLGVIHNPAATGELVQTAREEAKSSGFELVVAQATQKSEVARAYASLGEVDGVWLLPDQVVMNPESFEYLKQQLNTRKRYLLASLSEKFAEAGALVSVSIDTTSVGGQAAALAHAILVDGKKPAELGVVSPIGARLFVNLETAHQISLQINEDILPFVQVIGADKVARAK